MLILSSKHKKFQGKLRLPIWIDFKEMKYTQVHIKNVFSLINVLQKRLILYNERGHQGAERNKIRYLSVY